MREKGHLSQLHKRTYQHYIYIPISYITEILRILMGKMIMWWGHVGSPIPMLNNKHGCVEFV